MKRRLLVLSFHSPPEAAVGGLRWTGLSRHLAARGWEIRVITASAGAEQVLQPAGMTVLEVPRQATLRDHYRGWRKRASLKESAGSSGHGEPGAGSERAGRDSVWGRGLRSARTGLASLLTFPDHGRGWVLRAAGATRRVLREWAPDLMVSTGPPHSAHLAARIGLGRAPIPWIVDLRDPWATPLHPRSPRGWNLAVLRRLEGAVFRRASLILTTTPELRDALQGRFPQAMLAWLPNGVDVRELPPRAAEPPPGLSICHLGTVYFNRDPTPVLRAFARFLASHPDAAEAGSTLRFAGFVSRGFRGSLEGTVADLGLEQHVEITGEVPRERALEILSRSRMALVLAQGQGLMVPAKLYEAVGMGLPTMVVAEAGSATAREGERLCAAVHGPDDVTGMAATMGAVWGGRRKPDEIPKRVDHAQLAGDLEDILDALLARPRGILRVRVSAAPAA